MSLARLGNYDRPTDRTERPTDRRGRREVSLLINTFYLHILLFSIYFSIYSLLILMLVEDAKKTRFKIYRFVEFLQDMARELENITKLLELQLKQES